MKDVFLALLPYVLPLLASVLTAGTGWVAFHLGAYLRARAAGSRAAAAVLVLEDFTMSVVQDIETAEKVELERISHEGLTPADGAKLKKIAMDRVKAALSDKGLATLAKALGVLIGGDLDKYLSGKIEGAVAKLSVGSAPGSPK